MWKFRVQQGREGSFCGLPPLNPQPGHTGFGSHWGEGIGAGSPQVLPSERKAAPSSEGHRWARGGCLP